MGAESIGSWGAGGYGKGPEGEGRSGQGSVRMGVGSGELEARLFGSTRVGVRVQDGLEGPKGATTGDCVARPDKRSPVGCGPTGVRWLPWPSAQNSRGWLPGPSIGLAEEAGSQSGHEGKAGLHRIGTGVHQVLTN